MTVSSKEPFASLQEGAAVGAVGLSCILGLGISYFGLNARRVLSATAFTVLGAACKFVSVILNMIIWKYHAPCAAMPWLMLALVGSVVYQRVSSR